MTVMGTPSSHRMIGIFVSFVAMYRQMERAVSAVGSATEALYEDLCGDDSTPGLNLAG
jgi:hypothetical protein